MNLDTPTVSFITVLVVCLESGILTALWVIHRNITGVGYWAAGALAIAAGVLGISLRDFLPPFASFVIANLLIIGGYVLTWWGIEAFFGRRLPHRAGFAIIGLAAIGLIYFSLIAPDSRPRMLLLLGLFALLAALRAYGLLRGLKPSTRFSQLLGGTVLSCQFAYNLALAVAVWSSPPIEGPLMRMPLSGWIFLIPMLLSIAVVFAAVLLVNQTIAARLQDAARHDALTGALTRRALDEAAEAEIARSRRHAIPLTLLLLDIDHFKLVNDRYGHPAGDMVLRRFAELTQHCLRREDLFGRVGGEEFCALLPNTSLAGATQLAERIRKAIAGLVVDIGAHQLSLQVSIGIAAFGEHGSEWPEVVRHADAALYAAKHAGRNQVVVAGSF